jgi:hypothetical protein
MVKHLFALLVVLAFAAPAFAQDVPQFELGFGYGNYAMKGLEAGFPKFSDRHHGFTTHQTINLNSTFAIENYLGMYGFGTDPNYGKTELISELIGGRVSYRNLGPALYGSASIGGGFLRFTQVGLGQSAFGVKYGGGIDIPFKDFFAVKIDVSRMSYHFFDQWSSGMNISTGIVIKIGE